MLYFHYCKKFEDTAPVHVREAVRKALEGYSTRDSIQGAGKITSFREGIHILRLRSPYAEVILQESLLDAGGRNTLVYFVRAMKYSASDYVEIRDGKWHHYNPIPLEDSQAAQEMVEETMQHSSGMEKPSPPAEMVTWQSDYRLKVDYNIYESVEWVSFAVDNGDQKGMKQNEVKLYSLVLKDVTGDRGGVYGEVLFEDSGLKIYALVKEDIGILYAKTDAENGKPIYLLMGGGNIRTQKAHWDSVKHLAKNGTKYLNPTPPEGMRREAIRAYPNWALNDADIWYKIQKNSDTGNLALLPEQTDFLRQFKFPVYIDGQAGSGKSTMLQYLFANTYYYKYLGEIQGNILFLTENQRLLQQTKRAVHNLLYFNPQFDLSSEDIALASLSKHFSSFTEFLRGLLQEEDLLKFPTERYLDFPRFKIEYEASRDSRTNRYPAELVWFVANTYVFGYDLHGQITEENYETKMPRLGKELVPKEMFVDIRQNVISPFYERRLLNEKKYWNRVNLIKHLNEKLSDENRYEVIFCDEAQDFNRVELQFILGMSAYTQYDLSQLPQFPVVFAGDALQTVNPTGFRSEVLTAMIFEELPALGYPEEKLRSIEFSSSHNYRSSRTIVELANAVQYFRKDKLRVTNSVIKPQVSKQPIRPQYAHLNVFVSFQNLQNNQGIKEKLRHKTIIVPVNSGETEDYRSKHPILKDLDIISAVDAKGVEFVEVAVYGFGQMWLEGVSQTTDYEERFFFNKLYVAVTRAQHELVIIDTEEAKESFWVRLLDDYWRSDWRKEVYGSNGVNREDLLVIDTSSIVQSASNIREEEAKRQMDEGIEQRNIPLLQVAASHLYKMELMKEFHLCRAEIFLLKGDWDNAAKEFLQKEVGEEGKARAAQEIYWPQGRWQEFIDKDAALKDETGKVRINLARLLKDRYLNENQIDALYTKRDLLRDNNVIGPHQDAISEVLLSMLNECDGDRAFDRLAGLLEAVLSDDNKKGWEQLGQAYFKEKRYEPAAESFVKAHLEYQPLYLHAKLEAARSRNNTNDIIIWLWQLAHAGEEQGHDSYLRQITGIYNASKKETFKQRVLAYIYWSLMATEPDIPDLQTLAEAAEKALIEADMSSEIAGGYQQIIDWYGNALIWLDFSFERWAKYTVIDQDMLDGFNEEYRKLSDKHGLIYNPFEWEEIQNLPDAPKLKRPFADGYIQQFHIQSFRQFEDVEVKDLGLVNLIVGDNNVGKTSFLEALLFTPDSNAYLHRLAFAYIDRLNASPDKIMLGKLYYAVGRDFLTDFINSHSKKAIAFSIGSKRQEWRYQVGQLPLVFSAEDFAQLEQLSAEGGYIQPFMPYGKGFGKDLPVLYDQYIRPNRIMESEFKKNLELFIPKLEQVFAGVDGTIDIRENESEEDYPLHRYGEGANKLFRILILLTLHKGKRLMLDEIDAGVHFTKFRELWKIILTTAIRDNTQIFATTHNEECIQYFTEVLAELSEQYQNESRVLQMKKVAGSLKIRSYRFESFHTAMESGFEIRGGQRI